MDRNEIERELKLSYDDLCKYLQNKYGMSQVDYFATPECRSKNKKVTRSSEGLYCHHADEDKGGNLSNPPQAQLQPYAWQRKERLVYCNALEHLILHIKIAVLRQNRVLKKPMDIPNFFTTGGIYMVCSEINDMFMNDGTSLKWKQRCFEEFKDNYDDYIHLVQALMFYIDRNYTGTKSEAPFLRKGSSVHFADCDCEILALSKTRQAFILKMPNGEHKEFSTVSVYEQMKFCDFFDMQYREMALGYDTFYDAIYSDFINVKDNELIEKYESDLHIDYSDEPFEWGDAAIRRALSNE